MKGRRLLDGVALLCLATISVTGCVSKSDYGKQGVADIAVVDFSIKPSSASDPMLALAEFYRELFEGERVTKRGDVFFEVKVTPTSRVEANTTYFVTLMSKTGHIYDTKTVSWTEQDLAGPDPKERDIRVIKAAEQRYNKVLQFVAPMSDKEINPMVIEYFKLLEEKDKNTLEAILRGDIAVWIGEEQERFRVTTVEKVKIANKYVKVIIAGEKSG